MRRTYNYPYFKLRNAVLVTALFAALSFCSSPHGPERVDEAYKKALTDSVRSVGDADSLQWLLDEFIKDANKVGAMLCYKQIGIGQRNNAQFSQAIVSHQQGLELALELKDTVEIVQAYNNLGTNFRRLGAQTEASDYHYKALGYAESYSGAHTETGIKNRIVSLNGIGNVNLTLGYYDQAEQNFRVALKEEIELESPIGQAINYANLGAIFAYRNQYDSAFAYFNRSMEQNRIGKSDMGIGLCLTHIGSLYEQQQKYDEARAEYVKAYDLMEKISDKWHWLEACISLARINLKTGNISEFTRYIDMAENTAHEIKSPEHLSAIYTLKHDYDLARGDHAAALRNYKLHKEMQDSVQGVQKSARYMDIRVGYEQNRSNLRLQQIEAENRIKQQKARFSLYVVGLILLVSVIVTALLYYAFRQRSRSNTMLRKLEQTRSSFFTNITHEFRTPLTVIEGLNRQMQQGDITEKERQAFMAAISRQSNNLLNLVNQLLDISKLESGIDDPQWEKGNIVPYLQMVSEAFRLYAAKKDVALVFYSEPESLEMDFIPFYMEKIISNLLSNAIKHTRNGDSINLILAYGEKPGTANIRVSDTGEGIAEEDLERIFDLFYQSPVSGNTSGTGIGLSFSRMMVERMKGKITVESRLGEGSVFTVTLPVVNSDIPNIPPLRELEAYFAGREAPAPVAGTEEIHEEEEELTPEKPLVLIVEDNKDITMYIRSLLHKKYNVESARNGAEGLAKAEQIIPDLVISDVMMPVMDGYQFCRKMKENLLLNHIPVIMLTAKNTEADRLHGLRCGVEAYIGKPFRAQELLVRIEQILQNRKLLKEKYMSAILKGDGHDLANKEDVDFLNSITSLINSQIDNPGLNPTFLADKAAMSISQLNRKLNGVTGYSSASYIVQIRLKQARRLLETSQLPITEIAAECGFTDPAYFSRLFRKHFGISPTQYQSLPEPMKN